MINDVSIALERWLEPLTGTRTSGSYVSGRWVAGAPSDLNFYGVVQNATPKEKEVLPEGLESRETIKIHTVFDLTAVDKESSITGDVINYEGKTWRVYNIAYRRIGNYNKALAVRE